MSKSQLMENGFKDSVIETIYQLILQYTANESYKVYFPDMCIPCIIQVRKQNKKVEEYNFYCRYSREY